MAPASPSDLDERQLHEYIAGVEGHTSQVTGVVGYFYRMYRAEVLARVEGLRGRDVLDAGDTVVTTFSVDPNIKAAYGVAGEHKLKFPAFVKVATTR